MMESQAVCEAPQALAMDLLRRQFYQAACSTEIREFRIGARRDESRLYHTQHSGRVLWQRGPLI